ncbi:hypothetical protein GCM10023176_14410 [Micromonospora coerulea]|uniref:ScoMcrA-like DNA sulfur-binding domain-containing protein n=1 Tax=Micromonospora coerulea TaxID=47856 RepID=A0ABP8SAX6_9ACTN
MPSFGPDSKTGRAQSAAYPFTRLYSDGVWTLNRDVPMDLVGPLTAHDVVGQFDVSIEAALHKDRNALRSVARALVESHFPATIAPDVLTAAGLDPDEILYAPAQVAAPPRGEIPPGGPQSFMPGTGNAPSADTTANSATPR